MTLYSNTLPTAVDVVQMLKSLEGNGTDCPRDVWHPMFGWIISGGVPTENAKAYLVASSWQISQKDIDDMLSANTFSNTHDYCCSVCNSPMKKVQWNSGPKTHEYWYCKTCNKEEEEMQTRGKWIAKPVKEDQDGPHKRRQIDDGFFRTTDFDADHELAKRRATKPKP